MAQPYRYLVESIRTFPDQERFEAMIGAGGLRARQPSQSDRRHRRHPFGLAHLMAIASVMSSALPVPAGCSRAMMPSRRPSRSALPCPGRRAAACELARLGARASAWQWQADGGARRHSGRAISSSASSWRRGPISSAPARAAELRALQDRLPPFGMDEARADDRGQSRRDAVETLFSEFGPPVAAASIAQVHRATTQRGPRRGGEDPAARHRAALRPRSRRFLLRRALDRARRAPTAGGCGRVAAVETLAQSVKLEMDLRMEAAAIAEMARQCRGRSGLPRARGRLAAAPRGRCSPPNGSTARRFPTSTALQSARPRSRPPRRSRSSRASCAMPSATASSMPTCIRAICSSTRKAISSRSISASWAGSRPRSACSSPKSSMASSRRDYMRVAQVHFDAGYVPAHQDPAVFAQALRAIGEPIMDRPAREISMARLLTQLFEVTGQFDMATQPQLLLLQKTMVVVEGVARMLNPRSQHVGDGGARGARMDRDEARARRARSRGRRRGRRRSGGCSPRLPDVLDEAQARHPYAGRHGECRRHQARPRDDRGTGRRPGPAFARRPLCAGRRRPLALIAIALSLIF